ncbi:hypothetical protein [Comamonas endophytica]|uniref:Uncharacterized protein n=1 Tax=Comamonas endophytica TaxID=2949090 RepID=A0ABY6G9E9_9BURK|nr:MULTISPECIES: hypothetical protein [unclassified Acidovorax]MCD2511808.1 hypothetical protein [Acidovorax sp. D4N7]UYG51531.1 hypothetical protein M9799_15980 [Acidovorax sp. 5MLIR]
MSSTTPPTQDLAAHTFGRHHFSPPPLPEQLERPSALGAQDIQFSFTPDLDLDQRIRNVGEW